MEYDKGTSTLTIEAANIVIKGNITLTGGITSSADIVAAGISLDNRAVHSGILPGGSNTGGPV